MYDPKLRQITTEAFSRISSEMKQTAPFMEDQFVKWIKHVYGPPSGEYFMHATAFPMLLLPWWLEKTYHQNPDAAFQSDLVYSTMNGYFYIRLMDNLMDGHATVELKLLPALNFFHTQFQSPYQRHFEYDHLFWNFFKTVWFYSAEVTMKDANLLDINRAQFVQVTAQKTCAVKIPLAAVCYKYGLVDLITPWAEFVVLFGCCHQMWNDLFDWLRDLKRGTNTYFLSEAKRRKHPDEPVAEWVIREGFDWGMETLRTWMNELKALSRNLNSPDMLAYLDKRETMLLQKAEEFTVGLQNVAKLLELLS
ncbi:hypothetical protein H8E77_37520 [bacterium]|nr:hypothetical protein [bacterium]